MKVAILAAEKSENSGEPRTLTRVGNRLLLDRQLRVLKVCGFTADEIFVALSSESNRAAISAGLAGEFIPILVDDTETSTDTFNRSISSLSDSALLLVFGDALIEIADVDTVLSSEGQNVMLVSSPKRVSSSGTRVWVSEEVVSRVSTSSSPEEFPWFIFDGLIRISKDSVSSFRDVVSPHGLSVIEAMFRARTLSGLRAVSRDGEVGQSADYAETPRTLVGGSFANLRKLERVRKAASGPGAAKLRREIEWLLNLPSELRPFFPEVLEYEFGSDSAWFDMPLYRAPNLRTRLLLGDESTDQALQLIEKVLDFVFDNLYSLRLGTPPNDWFRHKHLNRLLTRTEDIRFVSDEISAIVDAEIIELNGVKYLNPREVANRAIENHELGSLLQPRALHLIHGDLHFQNILTGNFKNGRGFLLADPRGELEGSDPYYDLGKLFHSVNGLYDFLHTDQFSASLSRNGTFSVELAFKGSAALRAYGQILNQLPGMIQPRIGALGDDSRDWLFKSKVNEAFHFSSLMPFHLKGKGSELRAVSMYAVGAKLLYEALVGTDFEELVRC